MDGRMGREMNEGERPEFIGPCYKTGVQKGKKYIHNTSTKKSQ